MKIQVLGQGCARCEELAKRTQEAIRELGIEAVVEKVTDLKEITGLGVMITPALVVDGVIKVAGTVPSRAEIRRCLAG